jgi:hypothetical protein
MKRNLTLVKKLEGKTHLGKRGGSQMVKRKSEKQREEVKEQQIS